MSVYVQSETIERNGEQYVQINDINVEYSSYGDFKMNLNFDSLIPKMIHGVINEQTNSNWRLLKPQIECEVQKYISTIVHRAMTPILDKMPIRKFFL